MTFAKIIDGVCVNIMVFETEEKALEFDKTLVRLEDGYGIGDWYKDNEWSIPKLTEEEIKQNKIDEIKQRLIKLDNTINRATEDLYILTNTTPYQSTQEVITRKEELRKELQNLTKVGE